MSNERQTFTNKLEELFLSILRNVILLILAISVIASIGLLISGVSDTSAKPEKYKYEKFDAKQLANDLKESLKDEAKPAPDQKKPSDKKQTPPKSDKLKEEIDKQVKILSDFISKYGFEANQSMATNLVNRATKYGVVYGEGEAGILEYAKGQTQLFESILLDKDLNSLVQKKYNLQAEQEFKDSFIREYIDKVIGVYPEFHENQINRSIEFEQEQNAEALLKKAGATMKLYIAAGLFGAFLLISLILVLVKIERNLRVVRIDSEQAQLLSAMPVSAEQQTT